METRQRVSSRSTRNNENEIAAKTMGAGGARQQRTTLGQINSKSQDGPAKPAIRTTRAQQLRNKAIERKTADQPTTKLPKPANEAKIEVDEEPMDISMPIGVTAKNDLEEKIAAIELDDASEDSHAGQYVNHCFEYLRYKEHLMATPPRYLDNHADITPKMRSILVDWLVQVHKRFKLQAETLYLTVAIMDKYLHVSTSSSKNEMQLIGVTSMMLACKYEEIYSPEIDDFVYMCDNAYTAEELQKMELKIFEELDYNLGFPLSIQFLRRLSKTGHEVVDGIQHAMAKYLLELCLMDYDLCTAKPSLVAAAALKLSLELLADESWGPVFQHYSEYTAEDLSYTVNLICKTLYQIEFTKNGSKLTAIKKKYSESKNCSVASNEKITSQKELLYERARKAKEALAEKLCKK